MKRGGVKLRQVNRANVASNPGDKRRFKIT